MEEEAKEEVLSARELHKDYDDKFGWMWAELDEEQ